MQEFDKKFWYSDYRKELKDFLQSDLKELAEAIEKEISYNHKDMCDCPYALSKFINSNGTE